jgi:hypothetical protein
MALLKMFIGGLVGYHACSVIFAKVRTRRLCRTSEFNDLLIGNSL